MELHHLKLIQMPPMERGALGRKAIRSIRKKANGRRRKMMASVSNASVTVT